MDQLVTVMMSVYNPEDSVIFRQAVQSIIDQTYPNWEMILYDDGSADQYKDLIKLVAGMDERIRLITGEKNHGLGYAMNVCIRLAKGVYLARMDADDISHKERLRLQVKFLNQYEKFSWVGCNVDLIDGSGVWGFREYPMIPRNRDFLDYCPYAHPTVMFRKSVLKWKKPYLESRRGEDYALFMLLHSKGFCGYNIQKRLFQYREDKCNYKHRKFSHYVEEVSIRSHGFKQLEVLNVRTWPYVVKPLAIGVTPKRFLPRIKHAVRKETHVER